MDDRVMWLLLSTSGLLVLLNSGIGILALCNHRTGVRVTERLIASDELDIYHATWLTGYGYRETWAGHREAGAAGLALRALPAFGLAYAETEEGLVPARDAADREGATPPEHPLTLAAWRFTRDTWAAGHPVTVKALTGHPAFKRACAAHRERLSGHLPPRRTRRDDHADRAPRDAGLIAAGWVTLNTCVLMWPITVGNPGAGPERLSEELFGMLALFVGTAFFSLLVLVTVHVRLWSAWWDRWPRRLRAHCEDLIERESRDRVPLSPLRG
ncbi:hypothetical protein P3L51_19920 [Streptomyces sp. PSRA5]|uniref:hypothetical protein n=1 Tax=Streptomyces panacea TaxID=3035064 RepID=UPI00339C5C16